MADEKALGLSVLSTIRDWVKSLIPGTATASTKGIVQPDGTTITINDGVISSVGGGGGASVTVTTATLTVAGWSNNSQTVSVAGVTASNTVLVTYAPASKAAYTAADIYCTAQGAGTLTFACTTTPTSAITVNVMIFDGGVTPEYAIQNNSTVVTVASSASAGSTVVMTCIGSGYVQAVTLENVIVLDTTETVSGQTIIFTMPNEDVVVRNAFGTGTASGGSASISFDNLYLPEGAKKITIMRTSGGDN